MATYDPAVIQRFADSLYKQAGSLVASATGLGVIIGGFGGYAGGGRDSGSVAIAGALIFGLVGLWYGMQKAAALRLQAQTALCQLQIEANTRPR